MKKGIGIKFKVALAAVFFMGLLTTAIAGIGYKLYYDSVMKSYTDYTKTVLEYAYRASVKYDFGDMIAARDMPEQYEQFRAELNTVKDSSEIEYLYAVYFEDMDDRNSLHYAINAKTQAELSTGKSLSEIYTYMGRPCEAGAFHEDTLMILWDAVKSGSHETGILEGYSDGYGHMLNGYRVVFDRHDHPVGLICVEIDISRIHVELNRYLRMVILTASLFTVIILLIYLLNTHHFLTRPIERIAESSDAFVKKMQSHAEPEELVYDAVPIRSGGELRLLADNVQSLANGVASYMVDLRNATAESERIGTELELATKIQASMLPHIFPPYPDRHEFDIFATMEPAREVGGDFYDFFLIDDDHLCIVMADVSGKGIPAALFMMISKTILQSCAMLGNSAAEILTKTNEALCSNNQVQMFVTVWLGILEISTGMLTCANAGHEYPVLKRTGGVFELYKDKHSFPVGGMEGIRYKEYTLRLNPGDKLFLYTDGVPEATNAKLEMLGIARMTEALNTQLDASPQKLLSNVRGAVRSFVQDAEQFDDLTMLCIEYLGN